jgi:glutamyl/glutaminyl-tRNA synthetase
MEQTKKYILEELVEAFDLNRVHKAGAKFDPEKINGSITIFNQAKKTKIWRKPSLLFLKRNYGIENHIN